MSTNRPALHEIVAAWVGGAVFMAVLYAWIGIREMNRKTDSSVLRWLVGKSFQ